MRNLSFILLCFLVITSCNDETERMQGYDVHGIDVSHHQSQVNWDSVVEQDVHFAFIKATEGLSFADKRFVQNWEETQRVGIIRGAYHFYRPQFDARTQALNFRKKVTLKRGDLPPVLDVEVIDGASKNEIVAGMKTWLSMTELHYGIRPIIYTNLKFYYKYIAGNFDEYPLWIARYKSSNEPKLAAGKDWVFWQYGNRGQVSGVEGDVDLNVFKGDIHELKNMTLGKGSITSSRDLISCEF